MRVPLRRRRYRAPTRRQDSADPRPRAATTNGGTVNQNPPGPRPAIVPTVTTVGGNRTAARGAVRWRRPHAFCGIKTPAARKEGMAGGRGVVYGAAVARGAVGRRWSRAPRTHIIIIYIRGSVVGGAAAAVGARVKKNSDEKHTTVSGGRSGGGGGGGDGGGGGSGGSAAARGGDDITRGPVVRVRNISVVPRSVTRFVAFLVHLFFLHFSRTTTTTRPPDR